jgi:hypothetical protein
LGESNFAVIEDKDKDKDKDKGAEHLILFVKLLVQSTEDDLLSNYRC